MQLGVDMHYGTCNVFLFVKLQPAQHRRKRRHEISPYKRDIRNFRYLADRNLFRLDNLKALLQQFFASDTRLIVVKEDMKRIKILIFRVNAVTGKTASQTV